jgi:DNA helicase-2/ATP-dependent DNA helicase PcrA
MPGSGTSPAYLPGDGRLEWSVTVDRAALTAMLDRLNPEQRAAAEVSGAPTLVVAGPGTGKTTTLTGRYAHALLRGAQPRSILVSTFTKKAAEELQSRIGAGAGIDLKGAPIGTLHGLCTRLLGRNAARAGLSDNFRIISDGEVLARIRDYRPLIDASEIAGWISAWKDRLVEPEQAMNQAGDVAAEAARIYKLYQAQLTRDGVLDFGDLIGRTVDLLTRAPDIRARIANALTDVFIDEYQDVNLAQYRFIRLIVEGAETKLWCVGDPDQAIYEFRSADPTYLVRFKELLPGARIMPLTVNYRSTPSIVVASNSVIANNRNRLPLTLRPGPDAPPEGAILLGAFNKAFEEAEFVAGSVDYLVKQGLPPTEIAVLFRASWIATPLQHALARRGIHFSLKGAQDAFALPEARAFVRMMAAAWLPDDPEAQEALRTDTFAARLQTRIGALRGVPFDRSAAACSRIVLSMAPERLAEERRFLWKDTCAQLAAAAAVAGSIDAFLGWTRSVAEARSTEGVELSTIHSATGLEWDAVFLAGFEAGVLPSRQAVAGETSLEEERRLLYVAMTRARRWFTATWSVERFGRNAGPSSFLPEVEAGAPGAQRTGTALRTPRRAPWPTGRR